MHVDQGLCNLYHDLHLNREFNFDLLFMQQREKVAALHIISDDSHLSGFPNNPHEGKDVWVVQRPIVLVLVSAP